MTDLLTFIQAAKGTSLKIEVTSKDLLEFADALVERAAAKARAEIERQSDDEYIPEKEAIDLLGVCDATQGMNKKLKIFGSCAKPCVMICD